MVSIPALEAGDLFQLKFLRGARLSPDGRRIAYGGSRTDDAEHFEIWIDGRQLAFAGNARSPRWSPDGQWIAFEGDGRLHVVRVESLEISEPLTPEHLSMQCAPSWA